MTAPPGPIPMPRGERVPVVRQADCRYCRRYGHACGRHEEVRPA